MTLKEVEQELPAASFTRIHKSHIVSIPKITMVRKASVFIRDKEIPVGESYKENLDLITGRRTQG
jgi:two-component system LytT family response regulator